MNKWQRVLNCWCDELGHTGLTVQQLSYITGIPGPKLLKALRGSKSVRWQICKVIHAPVVGWSPCCDKGFILDRANLLAGVLLKLYPTPKYKGIRDWKGVTSKHHGIETTEFMELIRIQH